MHSRVFGVLVALAAILAVGTGCSSSSPSTDGGGTDAGNSGPDSGSGNDAGPGNDAGANDAGADAGPTVTITATRIIHHITDTAQVDVPANLSNSVIQVLVADPNADGGYDIYPGAAVDAGLLAVTNVPASAVSEYYLRLGNSWFEGTAASIDLSTYQVGRPGASLPDAGTDIHLDLNGLSPWLVNYTDAYLVSAGAGVSLSLVTALNATNGQTHLSGLYAYPKASDRIDANKGDATVLYQYSGQFDAGVYNYTASTGAAVSGFTVADGVTTELDAGLPTLSQQSVLWTYSGTSFDPLGLDVNANAVSTVQLAAIEVVAGGGAYGPVGALPQIFESHILTPQPADYALSGSYGNPFPPSWGLMGLASENWAVTYTLPFDGGTVSDTETAVAATEDLLATFTASDGGTLMPVIGPALNLSADMGGAGDQTLNSTGPVLTWNAPNLGTPTYYIVSITHLSVGPSGTVSRFTLTVYTTQTTVQLFPGLLLPGGAQYVVRVRAVVSPNSNFAAQPLFESFPIAVADMLSGVWTTP